MRLSFLISAVTSALCWVTTVFWKFSNFIYRNEFTFLFNCKSMLMGAGVSYSLNSIQSGIKFYAYYRRLLNPNRLCVRASSDCRLGLCCFFKKVLILILRFKLTKVRQLRNLYKYTYAVSKLKLTCTNCIINHAATLVMMCPKQFPQNWMK